MLVHLLEGCGDQFDEGDKGSGSRAPWSDGRAAEPSSFLVYESENRSANEWLSADCLWRGRKVGGRTKHGDPVELRFRLSLSLSLSWLSLNESAER